MRTIKMVLDTAKLTSKHFETVRGMMTTTVKLTAVERSMAYKFGVGSELSAINTLIRKL